MLSEKGRPYRSCLLDPSCRYVRKLPNPVLREKKYRYAIYRGISPEEFYTAADRLFTALRRKELDYKRFITEVNFLCGGSRNMPFVKNINSRNFGVKNSMVLLAFCTALVEDDVETLKFSQIRYLYGRRSEETQREFESGDHILFTAGRLEHTCDYGLADTTEYRLTDKAREELLGSLAASDKKKVKENNIIQAETLAEKKLHYPPRVRSQIDELASLLREDNFAPIVKRLKESAMKTGFACLFSGPPKTGKTETAYQIARATGRDIFFVDISETKSMWFGESEKRIKSLFTRYNNMAKHASPAPILLFNEADAILGKRQELGDERRGPAQTENAMQNILLQEIENLAGASSSPPPTWLIRQEAQRTRYPLTAKTNSKRYWTKTRIY